MRQGQTTTPGSMCPTLLEKSPGSSTSPANHTALKVQETGPTVYSVCPRRLWRLIILQHILLSYFKTLRIGPYCRKFNYNYIKLQRVVSSNFHVGKNENVSCLNARKFNFTFSIVTFVLFSCQVLVALLAYFGAWRRIFIRVCTTDTCKAFYDVGWGKS